MSDLRYFVSDYDFGQYRERYGDDFLTQWDVRWIWIPSFKNGTPKLIPIMCIKFNTLEELIRFRDVKKSRLTICDNNMVYTDEPCGWR